MEIDYILDCPCRAKDNLTAAGILERLKNKRQAETVIGAVESGAGAGNTPLSEIRFIRRLTGPDGDQDVEVSVQSLLDATEELKPYEAECSGCPASVCEQPFGCWGCIGCPIPRSAEQWLLELLPANLDSTAGMFLLKAIQDSNYDGAPVAKMRASGRTFFQNSRTPSRKWGGFFKNCKISSDQLLQMMFCVGRIDPSHSMLLSLFFGIIPHDISPEQLEELMQVPHKAAHLPLPPIIEQGLLCDESHGFAAYLATVHRAASLGQTVSVDV
jgi:hypothetical protein